MAAAENNSNVSALTTVATRLVFNGPVRAFSEDWWQDSDMQTTRAPNNNTAEEESQPEDTEDGVSMEVSGGVSTSKRKTRVNNSRSQNARPKAPETSQCDRGRNSPEYIGSSSKSSGGSESNNNSDKDSDMEESDDSVVEGAKSQKPNAVTPRAGR